MKTLKIFLFSALAFLFTLGFMYLIWAFVLMDINAFNWDESDRAGLAIFGLMLSSIPCVVVAIALNDN